MHHVWNWGSENYDDIWSHITRPEHALGRYQHKPVLYPKARYGQSIFTWCDGWGISLWHEQFVRKKGSAILWLPICLNEVKVIIWSLLQCLGVLCSGSIVNRRLFRLNCTMPYHAHVIGLLWHKSLANRPPAACPSSPSMLSLITIIDLLILLSFGLALSAIHDLQQRRWCPPGPRPLPIIRNLLDILKESSWLAYSQFSKKYGEVLSFVSYHSVYHWMGRGYSVLPCVQASYYRVELSQGHQGFTWQTQRILLWLSCDPIFQDVQTETLCSQFLTDNIQDGIGLVLTGSKVWWALASRMQGAGSLPSAWSCYGVSPDARVQSTCTSHPDVEEP